MRVIYVFDTYCSWCYGFESVFSKFLKNHPEISLEMYSGGLFVGGETIKASMLEHVKESNARITKYYGVPFGDTYEKQLAAGNLKMDSVKPAIAFALVREMLPKTQWGEFIYEVQRAFYIDGKDLNEPEIFVDIARNLGVDADKYASELKNNWNNKTLAENDFKKSDSFGVESFPTLLIEVDGKYHNLLSGANTVEKLEQNFRNYSQLGEGDTAPSCKIDGSGC